MRKIFHGRQSGATLIEVLIAVLVLAVGLLGIAAMQARALKNSQSSFERTQATILATSLGDAMRADLVAARGGLYQTGGWQCSALTGASLRDKQLGDWIATLHSPQSGLGSDACGQVSNCNGVSCTISVRWNDTRGTQGAIQQVMTAVTRI